MTHHADNSRANHTDVLRFDFAVPPSPICANCRHAYQDVEPGRPDHPGGGCFRDLETGQPMNKDGTLIIRGQTHLRFMRSAATQTIFTTP